MQRVTVTRLYRDRASHQTILQLEAVGSKQEIVVKVAEQKAGVLALEAHGLNDRCPLYSLIIACMNQLGGAFGAVAILTDEGRGNCAAISLSVQGEARWIRGDFVELIALALHMQLPILLSDERDSSLSAERDLDIPSEFYDAFRQDSLADPDENAPAK